MAVHLTPCSDCCGHTTPCNPSTVPTDLTLVFTWDCTQFPVTVSFGPFGPGGTDGWAYTGADIDVYDGLRFRAFNLWCSGGLWIGEFVYTQRNAGGTYIQQSVITGSGLTSATIYGTNPLCLLFTGSASVIDGGSFDYYFAVGPGCSVIPPCCNNSGLSSTATLTYTIQGMAAATLNLTRLSNHPRYFGNADCDVGDGHTVVRVTYDSDCSCTDAFWSLGFRVSIRVDGVETSYMRWLPPSGFPIGSVNSSFAVSCSPYHLHYEGNSETGSTAGGASQACGGNTYNFVTSGKGVVLDVVTP